jgi:hypothetical protein
MLLAFLERSRDRKPDCQRAKSDARKGNEKASATIRGISPDRFPNAFVRGNGHRHLREHAFPLLE